ncbi:hypothetical protein QBC39DRAFT_405287 [Podospora conica]|nr:hypothetical protein QBC39DRAFT_405287 [Schizothecium conicum]
MTSAASQQPQITATTPSASSAPSYASAAGASKKPTATTPLIAAGSHPPVVVGSSAPASQNGGKSAAPPVNGRPNITPAIPSVAGPPAIARSTLNGAAGEHAQKSSVTITGNGGPVAGGSKSIPQFGFVESPAVSHSTPHTGGAAPIAIPGGGNPRVMSPAHSPSPIPQMPLQSGGQRAPSSTQAAVTFGSFPGDGDRHMKQHSVSHTPNMGPSPHVRRDSQPSAHNEQVGHGAQNHPRGGGYNNRGRGGSFNNQYNPNMGGYPPTNRYNNAGPSTRGGMPPYQGRGGMPQYSPQPPRASPAQTPAMPHLGGTPTMQPAALATGQPYYAAPGMNMYQVKPPFIHHSNPPFKQGKKNKGMKNGEKQPRPRDTWEQKEWQRQQAVPNELTNRMRRNSKRWDAAPEQGHGRNNGGPPMRDFPDGPHGQYGYASGGPAVLPRPNQDGFSAPYAYHPNGVSSFFRADATGHIDLSPASGNFEQLLTEQHKQMNGPYGVVPPQMDGYRQGMMMPGYAYPQPGMPYMGQPQPAAGAYHQPFTPAAYNQGQPAAQSMSRNASQVSDRPTSSTGPSQAPVIASTPQQRTTQPAASGPPAIVSSSTFSFPKKSTIVIKTQDGKVVDFSSAANKVPASPSAITQQSKTPPVVAPTPTPPPKSSTPSHTRTESSAPAKTAEQLREEFKLKVRQTTEAQDDAAAKAAADKAAADKAVEEKAAEVKAAEEAKTKEQERLAAEKKAAEAKAAEEAKTKADADAKAKADAEAADKAAKETGETEEDEMERMIREMEEEDARREKEQEIISQRKAAEAAERKKREEADKAISAAENDKKLREQEREMERLEEEREKKREEAEAKIAAGKGESVAELLSKKMDKLDISDKKDEKAAEAPAKAGAAEKRGKPLPLNLSPLNTSAVEAPQPSAALQSLRSSRFLSGVKYDIYPAGIASPNPSLNKAVSDKGKMFKYDAGFLLQFQRVFTEVPSLEFTEKVKSLIGDTDGSRSASARTPGASGRQNSRPAGGAAGFPSQGAMGQFASKALPPGTTSEQRFAMASGSMARPAISGMAFGRTNTFPGPMGSRTPSSTNAAGIPNSPRGGSRRGGGGSKRAEFGGKSDAQAAKTMPLTAGMDLKPITTSSTGWKPTSLKGGPTPQPGAAHLDPELVQRKVKAALNKMTPEKFDKIADSILVIASQSKNEQDGRTLRQVIQLTFEKATDEAHWASMYAKFCKRMLETMSHEIRDENILDKNGNVVSGGALFRKYLLNRCQEEFERGWKIDLPEAKDAKGQEAVLLSDEYYVAAAAKRRGLGLVQFIGELFKLGMLTERIMHECVRKLLEFEGMPDEAEIESLTKLLRTVGATLDSSEKGPAMMDAYFQRIDSIVNLPDLPSRLRFMLMDIIDLRRVRWASKDGNKGPKTLEEVRAEAEAQAAQKALESQRSNQRGGPGGRAPSGRGDNRGGYSTFSQPPPNQVQMDDLRRLKNTGSRSSSQNMGFGPTSMFASRSGSGRRGLGPGGAFGRAGEDSGASSRTGTPPVRDSTAHTNAFALLADTGENPASPPSTSASPALSKAALANASEKKE